MSEIILCPRCKEPLFTYDKAIGYIPCKCGLYEILNHVLSFMAKIEFHHPSDCRYCLVDCGYYKQLILQGYNSRTGMKPPETCPWAVLVVGEKEVQNVQW